MKEKWVDIDRHHYSFSDSVSYMKGKKSWI
jgi:hypothetical protein